MQDGNLTRRPNRARPPSGMPRRSAAARQRNVSLCETLDRVLNKGAVIAGDVVVSVAGVDLLYLGLNVVVTSIETMRGWGSASAQAARGLEEAV